MKVVGSFYLAGGEWWPVAAALGAAGALLLAWGYARARAGASVKWPAAVLKALALTLLIAAVLEPSWRGRRAKPGANLLLIVADNSRGLTIHDGSDRTRAEQLQGMLDAQTAEWLGELTRQYQVRRYAFDSRVRRVEGFESLDFTGERSDLFGALRALADRYRDRPVAGIVLLTDGIATDGESGGTGGASGDLPPVYAVPVGRESSVRDLSVSGASVTLSAFEDAPVVVRAAVRGIGVGRERVYASLVDSRGDVAAEQTVRLEGDGTATPVQFDVKPQKGGVEFYRIVVGSEPRDGGDPPPDGPSDESNAAPAPATGEGSTDSKQGAVAAGEATLANNTRLVAVSREAGPYRVLYVTGRPNWEYKFLSRALSQDKEVELVALIRIARREPRFAFRGRGGETSNPLFRGFDRQEQEVAAEHDQPVLVRLNTKDEEELKGGFPVKAEELFGYHAIVIDDLEASFFAHDQLELIRRFVADRGGGLLMLGGVESFDHGIYARTPIADALPIYLDAPDPDAPPVTTWRWDLTREGLLQPWARLRASEQEESRLHGDMPAFQAAHRFESIKPGASVIATIDTPGGEVHPALIEQRYGRGRAAAIALGDLWRWGFTNPAQHADLDRAWRQTVRHLLADVPGRVTLESESAEDLPSGSRRMRVRVVDEAYEPIDFCEVRLTVKELGGDGVIELEAEPAVDESGVLWDPLESTCRHASLSIL